MKILYIGECDSFLALYIERHVKEGNSIDVISHKDFSNINKPEFEYKWHNHHVETADIDRIFINLKPNQVVFAGCLFGDQNWEYGTNSNRYLSELTNILNLSSKHSVDKFILLSSTEVYKVHTNSSVTEEYSYGAATYKGILSTNGERLVTDYGSLNALQTLILRFSDIYGYHSEEGRKDFLSNIINQLKHLDKLNINVNQKFIPLHLSDAVDALFRCNGNTPASIYNVAGNFEHNVFDIIKVLKAKLNSMTILIPQQGFFQSSTFDSSKIKKELEWSEFKNLEEFLADYEITKKEVEEISIDKKARKSKSNPYILHVLENVVFFFIMATLTTMFKDHSVLKNVDLMTLYIVSIALFFGIRQSIISVILTFSFYLYGLQFSFGNFIPVILNVDTFLRLAQYIFMGVVVGYTVDQLKANLAQTNIEKEYLENEYHELTEINDSNVMIKHQYEKRLISYKTSLPSLFAITNRLDSLDPEVIFSSIINVLVDVLETKTVSVYSFNNQNGYGRLISAKNTESIFVGKSFKLSDYKEFEKKMIENEIFIGDQWTSNTPSMAGPIFYKGHIIAIIVINQIAFESLNLYYINLFRTLIGLISSSFIQAYQFEEKIHSEKYLRNTDILLAPDFKKLIQLKQSDNEQLTLDYVLIKLQHEEDVSRFYFKVENLFRSTDYFGLDDHNQLHVLLRNTIAQDIYFVEIRLKEKNIHFEIVDLKTFL